MVKVVIFFIYLRLYYKLVWAVIVFSALSLLKWIVMKTIFNSLRVLSAVIILSIVGSCSDNDAKVSSNSSVNFDYELEDLVGIWESSEMLDYYTDTWHAVDDTESLYSIFSFKIRFNADYSYSLDGYISNESGTFTASKSVVATYVGGELQAEYDIQSLEDDLMTITLVRGTDATGYRLTKRW